MINYIDLLPAIALYFFGASSPGPATLAIAQVALEKGRSKAIIFSSGIMIGSLLWGIFVFTGLIKIMQSFPFVLKGLAVLSGLYMCYLGYLNIKKYLNDNDNSQIEKIKTVSNFAYFMQGFIIHVTNPKAFIVWSLILVSGMSGSSDITTQAYFLLGICFTLGLAIVISYSVAFSSKRAVKYYEKNSKYICLVAGVTFFIIAINIFISVNSF
ncbi:MAG: LysE family translocator [Cycloclasticus sp.]